MDEKTEKSLSTAFASAEMEGFQITPKIEADCRRIINGELSISDYIRQMTGTSNLTGGNAGNVVQP